MCLLAPKGYCSPAEDLQARSLGSTAGRAPERPKFSRTGRVLAWESAPAPCPPAQTRARGPAPATAQGLGLFSWRSAPQAHGPGVCSQVGSAPGALGAEHARFLFRAKATGLELS